MLFGSGDQKPKDKTKFEDPKDANEGNADQLMDMLGVTLDDDQNKDQMNSNIDDAIVIEDDAIIIEDDNEKKVDKVKELTEDDHAILKADK